MVFTKSASIDGRIIDTIPKLKVSGVLESLPALFSRVTELLWLSTRLFQCENVMNEVRHFSHCLSSMFHPLVSAYPGILSFISSKFIHDLEQKGFDVSIVLFGKELTEHHIHARPRVQVLRQYHSGEILGFARSLGALQNSKSALVDATRTAAVLRPSIRADNWHVQSHSRRARGFIHQALN